MKADHIAAFKANIAHLNVHELESLAMDFEEIYIDDFVVIKPADLPRELPTVIRQEVVALAAEGARISRQLSKLLDDYHQIAADAFEDAEKAAEAARPHCEACKQPLPLRPAKKTGKKRR